MPAWLETSFAETKSAGRRMRELLTRPGIIRMPGAHNALAGLIAKKAGFDALYVSGGAVTASLGMPDLGIMTIEDLRNAAAAIARATDLPLLVDGDTGHGGALNAMRLVHELEAAGVAAVHIEDQQLPKKCGHLSDKNLVSADDMAGKIAAAKRAARDMVIVARTDAAASEGLAAAIERCKRYVAAGADVAFPDALTSREEFRAFAEALAPTPVMANMTEFGKSPSIGAGELEDLGYKIVIWPVSSLRIEALALEAFYGQLASDGTTEPQVGRMLTRKALYELIGYHAFEELDRSIAGSIVPDGTFAKDAAE